MRLFCDDPELPPCPQPGRSVLADVLIAFGCAAVAAIGTALGNEIGRRLDRHFSPPAKKRQTRKRARR